jgi:hypothetical protein
MIDPSTGGASITYPAWLAGDERKRRKQAEGAPPRRALACVVYRKRQLSLPPQNVPSSKTDRRAEADGLPKRDLALSIGRPAGRSIA